MAPGKPVSASQVEMVQVVLPSDTNPLGNVFGGTVMGWIDLCAAVAAQRHCRQIVVTASMDALSFLAPIRLGYTVILRAQVNRAFHTSLEVGVQVEAENPLTGELEHCCSAFLTFVAIDAAGHPIAVPPVIAQTSQEHERYEEAGLRREDRLKWRHRKKQASQG
ncbi:MAG: acyl-CoA thioesterase [Chloroflexi bacterium]|nr:acyl-CoA thioesterase [Chloroflexota bacterium]